MSLADPEIFRAIFEDWPAGVSYYNAVRVAVASITRLYTPSALDGMVKPTEPLDDRGADEPLLAGRYRLGAELSRGGMGIVYRASDERMHARPVVIKVLQAPAAEREWVRRKFEDEARALVRLSHPNVVSAFDCGVLPDGRAFLVLEMVAGRSLRARLRAGPLPTGEVADVVGQVAGALDAAHRAGIYHRDLKPENVMLQELADGRRLAKLIDFGLATVKDSQDAETRHTAVAGTPLYMAPEQLDGKPCAATDTFALAVMAYEMLTARMPFELGPRYAVLDVLRAGVKVRPTELRPELPAAVDEVVLKSLSFEAGRRHASPVALAAALAAALRAPAPPAIDTEDLRATARPAPRPQPIARWLLSAVAVLGLVVGSGELIRRRSRPAHAPDTTPSSAATAAVFRYAIEQLGPGQAVTRLAGDRVFRAGDRIRLVFASDRAGHLYIVNEGPVSEDALPSYNVLFPSTAAGGSALVAAGREVVIPSESWFVFDEEQGVEQLWVVWSSGPVPEMERVKHVANPTQRGVVSGTADRAALRAWLRPPVDSAASTTGIDEAGFMAVRSSADVTVYSLRLEHR